MIFMKQILFLCILILITHVLFAQEKEKGSLSIGFSIGPSVSNLLNSEAPHKINIFGSDVTPIFLSSFDLMRSTTYSDYKTGILKDLLFGIASGIHVEYFIKNNLSLLAGFNYEPKGIDLDCSNVTTNDLISSVLTTKFRLKIRNNYITLPVLLRKYVLKEKDIFVSGGVYAGYLLSSRINYFEQRSETYAAGGYENYTYWIDNQKDKKRKYTNKFDFGISLGAGYSKSISDKLALKSELSFNIGLRKVDAKYNNEFSITPTAGQTGFTNLVRATNYYGLNSNSKNINASILLGLEYRIGK